MYLTFNMTQLYQDRDISVCECWGKIGGNSFSIICCWIMANKRISGNALYKAYWNSYHNISCTIRTMLVCIHTVQWAYWLAPCLFWRLSLISKISIAPPRTSYINSALCQLLIILFLSSFLLWGSQNGYSASPFLRLSLHTIVRHFCFFMLIKSRDLDVGFSHNESVSKIRVVIWKMFYLVIYLHTLHIRLLFRG